MKKVIMAILLALFIATSVFTAIPVHAVTIHYVKNSGSNLNGGTSWADAWQTIQFAVGSGAVAIGDEIDVYSGVYDEQVVIQKSLTIVGAGPTDPIIRPSGPGTLAALGWSWTVAAGTNAGWKLVPIVLVSWVGAGVTLFHIQVDGIHVNDAPGIASEPGWGGLNTWPVGIVYGESSGALYYVNVMNMNTAVSIDRSYGIWMDASTNVNTVLVQYSTVTGYYRNGIMASNNKLTVDIDGNVVTGPGTLGPVQLPNGIEITDGVAGTIRSNDVSHNHYNGGPGSPPANAWLSTGIMDWNGPTGVFTIHDNIVHDTDMGINPVTEDIFNNQIHDCTFGIYLEAGADHNTIHCNDIYKNTVGIFLMGRTNTYGYYTAGDEPGFANVANYNNIYYNTAYGVVNDDPNTPPPGFDATNNWWGGGVSKLGLVNSASALSTLATCAPHYQLTVSSTPAAHDAPYPALGITNYPPGWSAITASVTSPDTAGGTRYVCTGWTGTGDVTSSGSGTTTTFTITKDSAITWYWKTQYYLTVTSQYDTPTGAGWYDAGSTVTASVAPSVGHYLCTGFTGTGSAPPTGDDPKVTFTMNQPSSVTFNWQYTVVGGEWGPITLQAATPVNTLQLFASWITLALLAAASTFVAYRRFLKKRL